MLFFAVAALAATAAAEALQYNAPVAQGWEADLVARSEDCTTSSIAAPVVVSSATPCPSAGTTHITVTTTVTVTGLPGGAPPKDAPGEPEPTTTTTVETTTTQYTTITKTVSHKNGTSTFVPSGSGIPVSRNATSTGFNSPSPSAPQFTGAAAAQAGVSVAALFLGVVAANFV